MTPPLNRRALLAGIAAAVALPTRAQSDRPVRFILPNATGSGVDAQRVPAAPDIATFVKKAGVEAQ